MCLHFCEGGRGGVGWIRCLWVFKKKKRVFLLHFFFGWGYFYGCKVVITRRCGAVFLLYSMLRV